MSLTTKNPGNISKRNVDERKQATPTGIPIAIIVAFCVVLIPTYNSVTPLGFIALGYAIVGLLDQSWVALVSVPFILLVIADVLRNAFWRSVLFTVGSISLIVEWLITVREIKHLPWMMFLTSLPFIIVVSYWNARSLNSILRLDKRDTSIP